MFKAYPDSRSLTEIKQSLITKETIARKEM
jgi:hypothetical protein